MASRQQNNKRNNIHAVVCKHQLFSDESFIQSRLVREPTHDKFSRIIDFNR